MAIDWTDEERATVEDGIAKHGVKTNRCAALARIVYPIARERDSAARTMLLQPPKGAVWVVPKTPKIPQWTSHVYVETRAHAVDAVTGSEGYFPASTYVQDHWEYADVLRIEEVAPETVDSGIQDAEDES